MTCEMVLSILVGAAGLFLAVVAAYLFTWYGSHDLCGPRQSHSQTWLVGHVFLALNMRSEREPLVRLGFFSNKLMVIWVLMTLAFALVVTTVPGIQAALKTTPLTLNDWALLIPLALIGTFWLEVRKWATTQQH